MDTQLRRFNSHYSVNWFCIWPEHFGQAAGDLEDIQCRAFGFRAVL